MSTWEIKPNNVAYGLFKDGVEVFSGLLNLCVEKLFDVADDYDKIVFDGHEFVVWAVKSIIDGLGIDREVFFKR